MKTVFLKIDESLWRAVKAAAAMNGVTTYEYVGELLAKAVAGYNNQKKGE